jgi:hypothetical protein
MSASAKRSEVRGASDVRNVTTGIWRGKTRILEDDGSGNVEWTSKGGVDE